MQIYFQQASLVGWVRWRAAVRWTANQSGRKVRFLQHEALCKGLTLNKLTLKSLQNHHNAGRWKKNMELWAIGSKIDELELSSSMFVAFSEIFNKFLKERNIKIHPASRFKLYEKYLKKKVSKDFLNDKELAALEQAYYDLIQIAIITSNLDNDNSELIEKVSLLLKDDISISVNENTNTNGRDTQFELFVLSSIPYIGFKAEIGIPPKPDIVANFNKWQFGLEVKRIKSFSQIKTRVSKADKQMKIMIDGGIIVTDFSFFFQNGKIKVVKDVEEATKDLEERLCRIMYNNLSLVRANVNKNKTFSWFGYAQKLYLIDNGISIIYQWKHFNICDERDERWLTLSSVFHKINDSFEIFKVKKIID